MPRPGVPAKSRWSTGWFRRARLQHDAQVLDELGLTDELSQDSRPETCLVELLAGGGHRIHLAPGLAHRFGGAVSGEAAPAPRPCRRGLEHLASAPRSSAGELPQGQPQDRLDVELVTGVGQTLERGPDLLGPVTQLAQRGPGLGLR